MNLFNLMMFALVPSSSEDERVEKLTSKTVEVVKTEQPVAIRETRRFSETIAIDHKQRMKEMALQFKLPEPQKSEYIIRRESLPKGMKMEVRVQYCCCFGGGEVVLRRTRPQMGP